MLNKILYFTFFLLFSVSTFAANLNKSEDEISSILKRVNPTSQDIQIAQREKELLGRVSWKIQCRSKGYENNDLCIMTKGPFSIIKIKNSYTLSLGENHQKNSNTHLKIDSNDVITAREGLYRNADDIIEQFKNGLIAYSNYAAKNKNADINDKTSLIGFTAAFNDMENQYEQLKVIQKK